MQVGQVLAHHPISGKVSFYSSKFAPEQMPSPPKLPKEQQDEFERLQRIAGSQAAIDDYNRKISANGTVASGDAVAAGAPPELKTDIGGFSTSYLKTIPEFEGDVNPKTGERGGPKQDPLKFNDWSFNGRVTDF
ncbi:hypothetical protein CANTEDRAFT_130744 [Yamadazyma tenuis ATCC 10573]|uniref:Succinate dehydrogenase assembly factor 4, mitochondrial n=1 Tax=Candida tenuis (strain ATCC 10573 / BCRC 21748 / CBS 615 / JCM 9827 / NBRC 10315 / NRRL Y-1498 / VKM Y-70) TaxID=590646 RepID=G3B5K0_CANTC|nr:uncharacterized protein CANTEDRAFT_130744 [Yamadazyma tenuis ATCC 10573]EGV63249.1 hypothetical protein CANTEDRAFT_130744 [Yamadazyma tenuis ATCC 10573]